LFNPSAQEQKGIQEIRKNRQFHVSAFKYSNFKLNLLFTLFKIPLLAQVTNLGKTDYEKTLNSPS